MENATTVIKNSKIKGYYIATFKNVKIYNKEGVFLCTITDPLFNGAQAALLIGNL